MWRPPWQTHFAERRVEWLLTEADQLWRAYIVSVCLRYASYIQLLSYHLDMTWCIYYSNWRLISNFSTAQGPAIPTRSSHLQSYFFCWRRWILSLDNTVLAFKHHQEIASFSAKVDGMQFIFYPLGYRDSTEAKVWDRLKFGVSTIKRWIEADCEG